MEDNYVWSDWIDIPPESPTKPSDLQHINDNDFRYRCGNFVYSYVMPGCMTVDWSLHVDSTQRITSYQYKIFESVPEESESILSEDEIDSLLEEEISNNEYAYKITKVIGDTSIVLDTTDRDFALKLFKGE